jgi:predicted outer membrane repeat protein
MRRSTPIGSVPTDRRRRHQHGVGWVAAGAILAGCGSSAEAPTASSITAIASPDAGGCTSTGQPDAGRDASAGPPPIVVDTVDSETRPFQGVCSLDMAVAALARQADYGGCKNALGATSISIPGGTFDISSGLSLELSAAIPTAVSLVGHGVDVTILDTNGSVSPAVDIDGLTVTLSQLTVRETAPLTTAATTGIRLDQNALVTLDHVRVTGFTDSGVWNANATLTVMASTIDANSNSRFGGGLYQAAQDATATPTTFVNYSTISGNSAVLGGGIYNLGYLNLMYSTIAGNTATGGKGGGIYMKNDYLETAHCTIAFNDATAGGLGGGVYVDPSIQANVHINSSIIADNTASSAAPDYSGLLRDPYTQLYDADVLGSAAGVTTGKAFIDIVKDPLLGALGDNGGPTQTCALLAKSPAIDASRPFPRSFMDQRLVCAPYGSKSDVGAFEWRP